VSLLHRPTDVVTVFEETAVTDSDGNTVTRPSTVGVVCKAVVQPLSSTEDAEGTTTKHRLRLVGWHGSQLGAQSAVEWNGKRYAVDGDPLVFNGSSRTARVEYVLIRR
jgi:hypothetical protein